MNKVLLITSSLILALGLFSCKEKMPESLKPATTTVDGNLGALYELVDGEYKLDQNSNAFSFDIKRKDKPFLGYDKIGLGYEIYNHNGEVIISKKPELYYITPLGDIPFRVLELKPGETSSMTIYIDGWPDKLAGAETFKLIMECHEDEDGESTKVSTDETASNNWDDVLDEYESFVDKYIKLLKKAQTGDMSAMTEYAECLEKAESLQSKLENAKSDLTSAQVSRLNKIISKLSKAAM